ncbi:MAG: RNA polymerase sigma factor [Chloroflexi bacterium]|nr:MAG: RNA polymerase sigma factor [Chloroflexota bacterium]
MRDSTGGVIAASTQEATGGDAAAFVALVEPLLPAAYRLAVAMLRSDTDAEDAVQEATLKAWRHFGRFRREAAMKPWLLAIVANECRRQRRSRWFWVIKTSDAIDAGDPVRPEVHAIHADLRRALDRLPHDQRLVVMLRYYLDLSFDEVAQVMKISTKAAKSRTYRALERLRLSPEVLADE